jgi:hypothetical protein
MDKLLAKLSEQQAVLNQQNQAMRLNEEDGAFSRTADQASSSNSMPMTPATDTFSNTAPTTRPASANPSEQRFEKDELLRLKLQLAQAHNHISKLDSELAQSRTGPHEADSQSLGDVPASGATPRDNTWTTDDSHINGGEAITASAFGRARGIWTNPKGSFPNSSTHTPVNEPSPATWFGGRNFNQNCADIHGPYPVIDAYRGERLTPDSHMLMRSQGGRRAGRFDSRYNSTHQYGSPYGNFSAQMTQFDHMPGPMPTAPVSGAQGMGPVVMGMCPPYQQPPIGTPLSPHASEFTSKSWKSEASTLMDALL